jgi:hypothetical protein
MNASLKIRMISDEPKIFTKVRQAKYNTLIEGSAVTYGIFY